jgi:hypothetical protein
MVDQLLIPIRNKTKKPLVIQLFKWGGRGLKMRDDGGDVTNIQYKSNRNCHSEVPLCNDYILIKIYLKSKKIISIVVESSTEHSTQMNEVSINPLRTN